MQIRGVERWVQTLVQMAQISCVCVPMGDGVGAYVNSFRRGQVRMWGMRYISEDVRDRYGCEGRRGWGCICEEQTTGTGAVEADAKDAGA